MAKTVKSAWQRWNRRLAIVPALALVTVIVVAMPSRANIGSFESNDGNLTHDTTTDWNDFTGATPTGFNALTDVEDHTGQHDNIFGGGTKENDNCPSVNADGSLGGGSTKFDMKRIYLTHHQATVGQATHDFLYLAWERVPSSATASAHVAYEFNRGTSACGGSSDGLYNRIAGDKLIGFDFLGGQNSSTSPTLSVATWSTSGSCVGWCNQVSLNNPGVSEAAVNTVDVGTVTDTIQTPNVSLDPVQFGEAGIDLQAAGIDPCALNGHVTGVSRSSGDSGSAQMKDQVGPTPFTLAACTQATAITSTVSLDDHASIAHFDSPNTGPHTGTLTFELLKPGAACSSTTASDVVYTDTFLNVSSGGPFNTGDGTGPSTGDHYDVPRTVAAQGVYHWRITYTGDGVNLASDDCTETVDVEYGLS